MKFNYEAFCPTFSSERLITRDKARLKHIPDAIHCHHKVASLVAAEALILQTLETLEHSRPLGPKHA